ncbi:hypothetical protein [Tomitella biformata]|uniref:hypothetical protein n=1 Tax=Tomitella biformata TaxID=630403 RepID=UPI0004BAF233|nr:hypothetical protein [Tomitella biformata]
MTSLPHALETALLGILVLAGSIWIGGMVAVLLVARVSSRTLDPASRVAFFRAFGRVYGIFASVDLLIGLIAGAVLLGAATWTGESTALAVVAALLVSSLAWGIVQARQLTRLRHAAAESEDQDARAQVAGRATAAALLRGGIGVFSLALFVQFLLFWT